MSVCLSVHQHDNFRQYPSITTKLTYVNRCQHSMLYFLYRDKQKKSDILRSMEDFYWMGILIKLIYIFNITKVVYVIKIHPSMFSNENGVCICYTFFKRMLQSDFRKFPHKGGGGGGDKTCFSQIHSYLQGRDIDSFCFKM